MRTPILFAIAWVLIAIALATPPVLAEESAADLAKQAWAVTDVILDHQLDPPARQELLLGGLRALYQMGKQPPPADLSRRVSTLTTPEQFSVLLHDAWPKEAKDIETRFLDALVARASGRFVSEMERRITEQIAGNRYVGTGIQVRLDPETNLMQVVLPFRSGPAHTAGVKPGDLVLAVDGKSTAGETLAQVVERIRGEEGTKVSFTVRQPKSDEKREITMIRGVVPFEHVVGYRPGKTEAWEFRVHADEPIAYVRIKSITSSIAHELRRTERQLKTDRVRAVVLDLRHSAGALLEHAVVAADTLLDGGVLWRVRDREGRLREYRADRDCLLRDVPLVVLIDSTSTGQGVALLAAALQDNERAVLVGDASGFAGNVNSFVKVPGSDRGLVLRTGVVERVRSRPGEREDGANAGLGWRVQPDVRIAVTRKEMDAVLEWFQDKDLPEPKRAEAPPKDPPLARALELLREKLKTQPTTSD